MDDVDVPVCAKDVELAVSQNPSLWDRICNNHKGNRENECEGDVEDSRNRHNFWLWVRCCAVLETILLREGEMHPGRGSVGFQLLDKAQVRERARMASKSKLRLLI